MKGSKYNMARRKKGFIIIRGISDEANDYINKAIEFSGENRCNEVSTVCMFMVLARDNKLTQELLDKQGINYEKLITKFNKLKKEGVFGDFDSSNVVFTPDNFSPALFMECRTLASIYEHEGVPGGVLQLLKMLVYNTEQDTELLDFLEAAMVDVEALACELADMDDPICNKSGIGIPEALSAFVHDMHIDKRVTEHKISCVDKYVDNCIEVLSRKNKANPCVIGPAGVGKSTIVSRLVQRINNKEVPECISGIRIFEVDGGTLSAGSRFRGDFEQRMKLLLDWASSDSNIVLFFDEIHNFISSGKTSEDNSATGGQLIKPYISDSRIKIIGTTTTSEYHSFVEKDKALKRRLQAVEVKEPSAEEAIKMISDTIEEYEEYHGVKIKADIIKLAVRLSQTYMKSEYLPDKAYTILDQASAKTKLSNKKIVAKSTIFEVVSKNSGVDIEEMSSDSVCKLLTLDKRIKKYLIGQDMAVDKVTKAIKRTKAGVHDNNRPVASFMFVGPTGVGKTELCRVLCKEMKLGKDSFIKVDMSEYAEKYSISKLIGSAPGYVGYNEGGQLTEKIKHNPNSLVLFDEIEKAHPSVYNLFLQMLDEGKLTDGNGDIVDCANCIIVFTSNAGYTSETNTAKHVGFARAEEEKEDVEEKAKKALESTFKPEFLNRLDNIVVFNSIEKKEALSIVKIGLRKLTDRVKSNKDIKITFTDAVADVIADCGFSTKYGARNINREIQNIVEDELSDLIIRGKIRAGHSYKIGIDSYKKLTVKEESCDSDDDSFHTEIKEEVHG